MTGTKKNIWISMIVAAGLLLVLSLASCGGNDDKKAADEYNDKTNPKYLQYEDEKIGKGKEAKVGDKVAVDYTGYLFNGKEFDSSTGEGGTPFEFTIGNGEVIKGWDEGIQGMKKGGKRILIIPSAMAYGKAGSGESIPPDSPLRFEVELVKFVSDKEEK